MNSTRLFFALFTALLFGATGSVIPFIGIYNETLIQQFPEFKAGF